jgi:hypothetical protein
VTTRFAQGRFDVRVVFNEAKQVSGLWIKPAAQ